jgi:hypothetical protein
VVVTVEVLAGKTSCVVVEGPPTVAELVPEVEEDTEVVAAVVGTTVGLALAVFAAEVVVRTEEGFCPDVKVRDWPAASVAPVVYDVVVKRQVWMMSRTSSHTNQRPILCYDASTRRSMFRS